MPGAPLTLQLSHLELAAEVWGPDDGPCVLALHGWLDNAGSFDGLAPLLAKFRVVALDLPGHGRSAHHPAGFPYGFVDLVAEVHQAIEALGWTRLALLGHSLGAGIASVLAGTWPGRFSRVVLLDGLGPLTDPPQTAPERLARALDEQLRRSSGAKRTFDSPQAAVDRLLSAGTRIEPRSAHTLVQRGLRRVDGGWQWAADAVLRLPSRVRLTERQVHAFLRRIEAPVLIVRARQGFPIDDAMIAARVRCIRDAEVVEIDGHHHVHLDDPARVAGVVSPFLSALLEPTR